MVYRWMGRALAVVLVGVSPAAAESQPNAAARADAAGPREQAAPSLPSVPKLELSLPPIAQRAESPFGPAYWNVMHQLAAWRGVADGELRLRIETGTLQWGGFQISAGISSIPERERECAPSCSGPGWSSSIILRYPIGDAGPLHDVGPELEVGTKPTSGREGSPALLKAGVGGTF